MKDVFDWVRGKDAGDESAVANRAYTCGGGRSEDVDAEGSVAQRWQSEHQRSAEMACRPGNEDVVWSHVEC